MQRTFQGQVNSSEDNTFTNNKGEVVKLWKLTILLTDKEGMIFHIPVNHEQYTDASLTKEGEIVRVTASSLVKGDGSIKWHFDSFEKV